MNSGVAFLCGLLFSLGLGVSGMTQPGKVTAFLDFFGDWNPSLLFVMAGAILIYAVGSRLVMTRAKPLLTDKFQVPTERKVDRSLFVGALLFGAGWGLAGFCPGPALTSVMSFQPEPLLFTAAMLAGFAIYAQTGRTGPR